MSTQAKPSIVFAHGIWADGSCFSKVIPPLRGGLGLTVPGRGTYVGKPSGTA